MRSWGEEGEAQHTEEEGESQREDSFFKSKHLMDKWEKCQPEQKTLTYWHLTHHSSNYQ